MSSSPTAYFPTMEVQPLSRNLQSGEQAKLLDVIDSLRSEGINKYVDLPQLVVCGNQSSGKSSVLEAITGVQYPRNANLGTTFATELILRRSPIESRRATIRPAESRDDDERQRLAGFNESFETIEDCATIIERAKDYMFHRRTSQSSTFTEDVLCIEMSGPDQPHLTLVDLPGFIQAATGTQTEDDVAMVSNLVRSYMRNPRSIILAIFAANNDVANQVAKKEVQQVDPAGARTLGIITKPDRASKNELPHCMQLAKNVTLPLKLGWHVLKNRADEFEHCTKEQRDQMESAYFSSEPGWSELDSSSTGIKSLLPRLCQLFFEHICLSLPTVVEEIRASLSASEKTLQGLGPARSGRQEQQQFLVDVTRQFESILTSAIDGTYREPSFTESPMTFFDRHEEFIRLRSQVVNLNEDFAREMEVAGRRLVIDDADGDAQRKAKAYGQSFVLTTNFHEELRKLVRQNRGCELPGTFNPLLVGQLFRMQSQSWESIAQSHLDRIWHTALSFVTLAIDHVASPEAADILLCDRVVPQMEHIRSLLDVKLKEIMKPYRSHHPMTYDTDIRSSMKMAKDSRMWQNIRDKVKHRVQESSSSHAIADDATLPITWRDLNDLSISACRDEENSQRLPNAINDLIDLERQYYYVALRGFIDNVAALVVENVLMGGLPEILNTNIVTRMSDEDLETFAGEHPSIKMQRTEEQRKKEILSRNLRECAKYAARATSTARRSRPRPNAPDAIPLPALTRTAEPITTPVVKVEAPSTTASDEVASDDEAANEDESAYKSNANVGMFAHSLTRTPSRGRGASSLRSALTAPSRNRATSSSASSIDESPSGQSNRSTAPSSVGSSPMRDAKPDTKQFRKPAAQLFAAASRSTFVGHDSSDEEL